MLRPRIRVANRPRAAALLLTALFTLAMANALRSGVQPTTGPRPVPVAAAGPRQDEICTTDWVVWSASNAANLLQISTVASLLEPGMSCQYPCGGQCPSGPVVPVYAAGPFESRTEAVAALCAGISEWGRDPIGSPCPFWVVFQGKRYASSWSPGSLCGGAASVEPAGVDVPGQGICLPGGVHAGKSSFRVVNPGLKKVGRISDDVAVEVIARDAIGRPLPNVPVQVHVSRRCGGESPAAMVRDVGVTNAEGMAEGPAGNPFFREPDPGEHVYRALVGGVALPGSASVTWLGEVDARQSRVEARPTAVWANDDDPMAVDVVARDRCGSVPYTPGESDVTVLEVNGPDTFFVPRPGAPQVQTDASGLARFRGDAAVRFEKPGDYTIAASLEGRPVDPIRVVAEPPPVVERVQLRQANFGLQAVDVIGRSVTGAGELVHGKDTLVRLFLRNRVSRPVDVSGRLASEKPFGGAREDVPPLAPARVSLPAMGQSSEADMGSTLNFVLPARLADRRFGLGVELSPKEEPAREQPDVPLAFLEPRTLRVAVLVQTHNGVAPSAAAHQDALRMAERLFPARIDPVRASFPITEHLGGLYSLPDQSAQLQDLLAKLGRIQADRLIALMGAGGGSRGPILFDPATRHCSAFPALWVAEAPGATQWSLVHELGHSFCLLHNSAAGGIFDAQAPVDIEDVGIDLSAGTLNRRPATTDDFMVQADATHHPTDANVWIGPYRWRRLLAHTEIRRSEGARIQQQRQGGLLVAGRIYADGRAGLEPLVPVDRAPDGPGDGAYCVRLEGIGGEERSCFHMGFADEDTGVAVESAPFFRVLPAGAAVTRVALERDGVELEALERSANGPVVAITSPRAGESWSGARELTWQATDADGDALQYEVRYRLDGGDWRPLAYGLTETRYRVDTTQMGGGSGVALRVIATDGLNVASADVGPLNVPRRPPTAVILEPADGAGFAPTERITLRGAADDPEDGPLGDEALSWSSDRDGALGAGRSLWVDGLAAGPHTLTLSATDGDGRAGSASITIFVRGDRLYLPLAQAGYDRHWDAFVPATAGTASPTPPPPTQTPPPTAPPTLASATPTEPATAPPPASPTPTATEAAEGLTLARVWTADPAVGVRTAFVAGDVARLWMQVANPGPGPIEALLEWAVYDPAGSMVADLSWSGPIVVLPDRPWWNIERTVPAGSPLGEYRFVGRVTAGGRSQSLESLFYLADSVALADDFEDPGSGWPTGARTGSLLSYRAGEYVVRIDIAEWLLWSVREGSRLGDTVSEVRCRLATGAEGQCGLSLRVTDDSGGHLTFLVSQDRQYQLALRVPSASGGHWEVPVPWTPSEHIAPVPTANHLMAVVRGTEVRLYANGRRLTTATVPALAPEGRHGVVGSSADEPAIELAFDNYRLLRLGGAAGR